MNTLSKYLVKQNVWCDNTLVDYTDEDKWVRKNHHYYKDLCRYYKFHVPEGSRVLEVGSGSGYLLNALNPSYGVGIDISENAVKFAKKKYTHFNFYNARAEEFEIEEEFDYVIISDTLSLLGDIQEVFNKVKSVTNPQTRIIINSHNFLWLPLLKLAERLNLKSTWPKDNWLNVDDIEGILRMEKYEVIKRDKGFIFPIKIPVITDLINKYVAKLPIINRFCLINFIIARPLFEEAKKEYSVSVVVPARNEEGNIENVVKRIPKLGKSLEIVFVEGGSTDATYKKIEQTAKKYNDLDIKYCKQSGKGKADAVQKGFEEASGEILMILDSDLTVPPENLTKFYDVISSGIGEFVYGSRLVYEMESGAMDYLNVIGNKFFSIVFSWILNIRIKDTLCGTKVIKKSDYKRLDENRHYFGNFDPFGDFDLLLGASKLDLKFVEIPIKYKKRTYGATNISRFKNGLQLLRMAVFSLDKTKFI